MAEQNVSDLIMKFEDDSGPIDGEVVSNLELGASAMTAGFRKRKMFEVQSFTLKTGLGPKEIDEAEAKIQKAAADQTKQINKRLQKMADKLGVKLDNLASPGEPGFAKFLDGDDNAHYPVDMKPMEFTRAIDKSSAVLLQHCIERKLFRSATLIKRKATGGPASGEVFLRFDFTKVLIKSVDWDDGEPIKETVEFVCRAVTINYLPQLPDGTLGYPKQTFWSAAPGLTAAPLA